MTPMMTNGTQMKPAFWYQTSLVIFLAASL